MLDGLESINFCVGYEDSSGQIVGTPRDSADFESLVPVYEAMPGWQESTLVSRRGRDCLGKHATISSASQSSSASGSTLCPPVRTAARPSCCAIPSAVLIPMDCHRIEVADPLDGKNSSAQDAAAGFVVNPVFNGANAFCRVGVLALQLRKRRQDD